MAIQRGKTNFLLGIDKVDQLTAFLREHPRARGVAFIGRSNVGKSSLINALFGNSVARVSKTPGRTRQVNVFSFEWKAKGDPAPQLFFLFDVPGYGHAEVSKEMARNWQELMDAFFQHLGPRVLLLNIQDSRHPLQDSDEAFHQYIKSFDLHTHLIFNKIDKLKTQKERAALKKIMPDLYQRFQWVKQIYFTSAKSGEGIPQLAEGMMGRILSAL